MEKRKIFEIKVRDNMYPVYDIRGKEHNWGKWNGQPNSWWVDMGRHEVGENGTAVWKEDLVEFHNKDVSRESWDIRFKENNSMKYKWDEVRWYRNVTCEMWSNNKLIYQFTTRDIEYAMSKAQVMMVQLSEHSYNFFNPEEERGRKIFFHGLPATIQPSEYRPWEISIYPDLTTMSEDEWWSEYKKRSVNYREDEEWQDDTIEEYKGCGYINWGDAFSDGHIWWFRK